MTDFELRLQDRELLQTNSSGTKLRQYAVVIHNSKKDTEIELWKGESYGDYGKLGKYEEAQREVKKFVDFFCADASQAGFASHKVKQRVIPQHYVYDFLEVVKQ